MAVVESHAFSKDEDTHFNVGDSLGDSMIQDTLQSRYSCEEFLIVVGGLAR